jgi:hypothetical protein
MKRTLLQQNTVSANEIGFFKKSFSSTLDKTSQSHYGGGKQS